VQVLKQHALVTVDDKDLGAIHSLTQLAVRGQADKGDRRGSAAAVARGLEERLAKFDQQKPSTFFIGRRYAAHARAAAANIAAWGLIPGLPALASPGAAHRGVGRAVGGGGEARGGRSLLGDVHGMCMSAGTFFQTVGGQYSQALGMHEIALVCVLALEGHDSPDVAASFISIGVVYAQKGDLEDALIQFQKALEIRTRVFGSDHPDVASSFINIGAVYAGKGDLENALVQYQKALEIRTRVFGSDHPSVADSKYNLALLHKKRKETDIARQLFLECEQIYTIVYGPHHRETVGAVRQASLCV